MPHQCSTPKAPLAGHGNITSAFFNQQSNTVTMNTVTTTVCSQWELVVRLVY